ncbi:MAG: histidine phosphatase family protein [Gemmatimonadales bacterium]
MDHPPGSRTLNEEHPTPAGTPVIPEGLEATIVLLRHGESDWVAEGRFQGQGNPELSPEGLRQAAQAGSRLAHPGAVPALPSPSGPPLEIRHSPLARTSQTAAAVAAAYALRASDPTKVLVVPDAGLLEIGQGLWEGRLATEIEERWGDVLAGWRQDPLATWAPEGEPLPAVDRRVRASLGAILGDLATRAPATARHGSQVLGYAAAPGDEPWLVLVGHDGVFKIALLALLDLPLTRFWSFPFALCGITVIEIRAGRARLRAHNLTEHLGPLETERQRQLDDERGRSGAL